MAIRAAMLSNGHRTNIRGRSWDFLSLKKKIKGRSWELMGQIP